MEIFSLPKYTQEIYKKYYQINIHNNYIVEHTCNNKTYHHLLIPKLPSNINRYTTCYNNKYAWDKQNYYCCNMSNNGYDGIENIKLILTTEHLLEGPAINLIKVIRLQVNELSIAWYNIGLKIMQKIKKIHFSEICYQKNKLWCYE